MPEFGVSAPVADEAAYVVEGKPAIGDWTLIAGFRSEASAAEFVMDLLNARQIASTVEVDEDLRLLVVHGDAFLQKRVRRVFWGDLPEDELKALSKALLS